MELDEREARCLEHIKTWQQSGATQNAYCKTNGIHPKTFSNWKRRFREHLGLPKLTRSRAIPPNPVAPLVAVKLIDDPVDASAEPAKQLEPGNLPVTCDMKHSGFNLSIGKYQIAVAADFDSDSLRRLLAVLAEAP
jgi:hypothetical protein